MSCAPISDEDVARLFPPITTTDEVNSDDDTIHDRKTNIEGNSDDDEDENMVIGVNNNRKRLWQTGEFFDLIIQIGTSGPSFKCHKCIVAVASGFYYDQLQAWVDHSSSKLLLTDKDANLHITPLILASMYDDQITISSRQPHQLASLFVEMNRLRLHDKSAMALVVSTMASCIKDDILKQCIPLNTDTKDDSGNRNEKEDKSLTKQQQQIHGTMRELLDVAYKYHQLPLMKTLMTRLMGVSHQYPALLIHPSISPRHINLIIEYLYTTTVQQWPLVRLIPLLNQYALRHKIDPHHIGRYLLPRLNRCSCDELRSLQSSFSELLPSIGITTDQITRLHRLISANTQMDQLGAYRSVALTSPLFPIDDSASMVANSHANRVRLHRVAAIPKPAAASALDDSKYVYYYYDYLSIPPPSSSVRIQQTFSFWVRQLVSNNYLFGVIAAPDPPTSTTSVPSTPTPTPMSPLHDEHSCMFLGDTSIWWHNQQQHGPLRASSLKPNERIDMRLTLHPIVTPTGAHMQLTVEFRLDSEETKEEPPTTMVASSDKTSGSPSSTAATIAVNDGYMEARSWYISSTCNVYVIIGMVRVRTTTCIEVASCVPTLTCKVP